MAGVRWEPWPRYIHSCVDQDCFQLPSPKVWSNIRMSGAQTGCSRQDATSLYSWGEEGSDCRCEKVQMISVCMFWKCQSVFYIYLFQVSGFRWRYMLPKCFKLEENLRVMCNLSILTTTHTFNYVSETQNWITHCNYVWLWLLGTCKLFQIWFSFCS
jgi:hypothetical protein